MKNRISPGNQIPNQTLSKEKNITLPLALFVLISYNLFFTICLPKRGLAEQEIKDFDYWASLCELLKNEKNDEEALAAYKRSRILKTFYDQAIRINPNDANVLAGKGLVLVKVKRLQDAITTFEQALKLDPSNAIVLRALPDAIAQQNRDNIKQPLDEKQHKHWLDSLPKNIDARKEEDI